MIFLAGYQIVLLLTDSAHCHPTIRGYHVLYSKVSFCYDIDARDSVRATPPLLLLNYQIMLIKFIISIFC